MRKALSNIFLNNHSCIRMLSWLLMIPVFLYTTTLTGAIFTITLSTLLFFVNIAVDLLLNKFKLSQISSSITLFISGIIYIVVTTLLSNIIESIYIYCFSAVFLYLFLFNNYYNQKSDAINIKIITTIKTLVNVSIVYVLFSIIREFLITGDLLGFFNKQGIMIIEFGSYPQTESFTLLYLAICIYIFSSIFKRKNNNYIQISFQNITKDFILLFAFSLTSALIVIILSNILKDIFIFSKFHYILPFVLSSVLALSISLFKSCSKFSVIYSSLVYVMTVVLTSYTSSMLINSVKLFFTIVAILIFIEYCEKKSSNRNATILGLVYASIVTAVFH